MADNVPLTEGKSIVIGFLSGSLIASAFASFGIPIQVFLFIIGVLVFAELSFSFREQVYIASGFIGWVIGIIVTFLLSIYGLITFYIIAVFILTMVLYARKYIIWRKSR